ncbi:MAG: hypothetical protein KF767_18970, partial [Bdellovibrionaceae bacterium]|nr:hypothetical protein [Pseudobdellovibrionaceae bacterium]
MKMLQGFALRRLTIAIAVSTMVGAALPSFADSNQLVTYQGRILRPDGTPLEGTIDFQIKIFSPGPSKCLLWSERQTVPMQGSKGAFSLEIGKDVNRLTGPTGGGATSFGQVFVNHPNLVIPSAQCNTGYTGYTSNFADDRTISVTFSDAGQEIRVVDLPVKSVPFAMQAEQISGYSVNYLFKVAGPAQPGVKAATLFSRDAVDLLWELAENQDLEGKQLHNVGTPIVGGDAANKDYVDTQIASQGSLGIATLTGDANILVGTVGNARNLSLGTTGVAAGTYGAVAPTGVLIPVIQVDMWGRITSANNQAMPVADGAGQLGLITVDTTNGLSVTNGTLGLNLTNLSGANFGAQAQNVVFAGPASGGSGPVSFRQLVEEDIPVLAATGKVQNSATTATPALTNDAIIARDATGAFTASAAFLNYLALDNGLHAGTSSAILLSAPMGASYSLVFPNTAPQAGDILSFDGLGNMVWVPAGSMGMTGLELVVPAGEMTVSAPVGPGEGTLSIGWRDQNARLVFAAPIAGSGQPTFRSLDPLDIPDLDASKINSGTFDVARIPDLDAAKITTGTLGVQRGGTGLDGSVATTGQLLIGTGTGGFALGNLYGGSGVLIDNQSGSIGISFNPSMAGVVTHVGAEVPSFMSVSPSGISSSGTFQFSYNSQAQNLVFAAPTGGSGAPDFRALHPSDIPNLDAAKITSGTLDVARIPDLDAAKITSGTLPVTRGGTGLAPQVADANRVYGINAAGDNSEFKTMVAGSGVMINHTQGSIAFTFDPAAAGVVTNVGLTAPTSIFNVSGSAVTGAGTLGLHLNSQNATTVLAAPTGGSGAPEFRALTPYDIPYLDTSHLITGLLPVERGGTGLDATLATDGQLLIADGTGGFALNTLTALSGVVIQNSSGSIAIGFDPSAAGVVTNVGLSAPTSVFTVSGSAITGAGTLGLTFNSQDTATVFAAPTGASGVPSFRSLVASDITAGTLDVARIPDLDAAKITSGTLRVERGGTGLDGSVASSGQLLIGNGTGFALNTLSAGSGVTIINGAGSISIGFDPSAAGVVTNIGATVPSYMSVAPGSISSAGTFAFDFNAQNQNLVFAAPTGGSGAPGFRQLEPSDIPALDASKITSGTLDVARIPDLDAAKITSGTLPVTRGGTGLAPQVADANRVYGINAAGDNSEFKTMVAGSGVIINHSQGSIAFTFDPAAAGVVTNVGLTAPTALFTVSGSAVTGAGTLGLTLNSQNQNLVFAAPTGGSGAPGFRQLEPSDIPVLDASKITSGTLDVARIPDLDAAKITSGTLRVERGGTGLDGSVASSGQLLIGNGTGFALNTLSAGSGVTIINGAGSISIGFDPSAAGVVTNVGATVPSYMSVAPGSISSAGTFAFDFNTQNQNLVFAAPTGGSGAPGFRQLEPSDIPVLDASKITSGTLDVARIPDLDAAKITSGTLRVERGGTGLDGSAAASGQLLIGNGTGFALNTLSAGSGVTITNGAGSISIGFNPSAAGVVTNVGLTAPTSVFDITGSAVTGAGTLGLSFLSQETATVLAAPTGASGVPFFRSLIASDITAGILDVARIPDLDAAKITSGTLRVERGGTGLDGSAASSGQLLIGNGTGFALNTLSAGSGVTITNGAGSISIGFNPSAAGVVTNIGATVPSYMSVSPSSISSAGTFAFDFNSQNQNLVFAAPTGGSGAPGFRQLEPSDIPNLDAAKITSGTLDVARIPDLDAAKITSGTLRVERGGTGLDGSAAASGQLLIGNGTGFALNTLSAGSGVTITNGAGSISIGFNPSAAGVVTNVGLTAPTALFTVSGSAVTGAGTLDLSLNAQNQNLVFAAPTGGSGAPGFRQLDPSDIPSLDAAKIASGTLDVARIPDLDAAKITSGTLPVTRGGTGLAPQVADANRLYGINSAGTNSEFKTVVAGSGVTITHSTGSLAFSFDPSAAGVVTNVGLTAPTSVFDITGSAVTGAGTLGLSFLSQETATVLAAPTGASGIPSFRSLIASDITAGIFDVARIPDLDAAKITSGTLPVTRGGTGLDGSAAASGQLLIGNGSGFALNTLSAGSGVTITNGAGSISIGFNPSAAGVVTNVGLTAPTAVFSVTGSAVTGAGTLGLTFNPQNQNLVFAAPTGGTGAPEFRPLDPSDIPNLDAAKITSGTLDVARIPDLDAAKITSGTLRVERGGTGLDGSTAASGQLLIGTGTGFALNTLTAGSGVTITNAAGSIAIGFNAQAAGVVTNIGATVPSYMSVSPSSISSSGTFAFDFNSQNTATVFAAPTGASGVPSFRSLVASDITAGTFDVARIPDLDAAKITSGTLPVTRGGTGLAPQVADANRLYGINAAGTNSEFKTVVAGSGVTITHSTGSLAFSFDPSAAGVVTNVGLTAPSSVFDVTGSAVTGAGTLGLSFLSQNTATVLAAPTGASGVPSFRSLIASDITSGTFDVARIPDLDAAKITTGTLPASRGGTGLDGSTAASGRLLIGTGSGYALG